MPEGHTIRRVARDHQRMFAGQTLAVSSPQGRFCAGAKQLHGRTLTTTDAHGKHLFYHWDDLTLHVHLGLYGKFRRHAYPPPDPRGAVRLRVTGAEHAFDLVGPTACELIDDNGLTALRKRLGPDPLRPDADPEQAWRRISRSRAPIGKLILDQAVIAGAGNVYRAEILFILGLHPERPGKSLARAEFDQLWNELVRLMRIGVSYNRIITADPEDIGKPRGRMKRDERLLIYKKSHCPKCSADVDRWELGARTIYACLGCQR